MPFGLRGPPHGRAAGRGSERGQRLRLGERSHAAGTRRRSGSRRRLHPRLGRPRSAAGGRQPGPDPSGPGAARLGSHRGRRASPRMGPGALEVPAGALGLRHPRQHPRLPRLPPAGPGRPRLAGRLAPAGHRVLPPPAPPGARLPARGLLGPRRRLSGQGRPAGRQGLPRGRGEEPPGPGGRPGPGRPPSGRGWAPGLDGPEPDHGPGPAGRRQRSS